MKKTLPILIIALFYLLSLISACGKSGDEPVVLFDQGHGQQFLIHNNRPLDLSDLAILFSKEDFDVQASKEPITEKSLKKVDILVVSGPFAPFTEPETRAITSFVENGGRLCIMLHIASPAAELLKQLGVAISNGSIREQTNLTGNDPRNFKITTLEQHPLNAGLTGFNVYGCWALLNTRDNAQVLALTSPTAWIDLNMDNKLSPGDAMQPLGVMVTGSYGKGAFVVFGDDAIFQNQFLKEENEQLAKNLISWLKASKEVL